MQPFDFIKHNIIQKSASKIKYIGQISGGLLNVFLEIWE